MLLKVLIVDGDYDWADRFASNAFSSDKLTVVGIESDLYKAAERITEHNPSLVLVDQSAHNGAGIQVLEKLTREFGRVPFIFTTVNRHDIFLWRSAMSKGAVGVLYKEYTVNGVLDAASRYLEEKSPLQVTADEVEAQGGVNRIHQAARESAETGKRLIKTDKGGVVVKQEIITVYSPKGGVGKTTVSCNLAAALAVNKLLPLRVCLVDLDVSFGTVVALMNVDAGKYSILDWDSYRADEFDRRLLEQLVIRHKSGLDLIPQPSRTEDSALINRVTEEGVRKGMELTEKVLKILRNYYDMIVIDVGSSLREDSTITAIESSTKVLVVGVSDVPTLRNIMSCQRTFDKMELDQSKMRVVLNRFMKGNGLDACSLSEIIPYMVIGKIPDDQVVQRMANEGKLSVLDMPHSPFAEAIFGIANTIVPVYTAGKKGGLFFRPFKRKDRKGSAAL